MAKVSGSYIRKTGEVMSLIERQGQPKITRKAPVRVKLERINCDVARSLPPDGDHQVWFDRLMAACGSASPDFVDCVLFQLQAAARLPNSGRVCEIGLNAALAFIEGERPNGETECAIVVQMASLHAAAMVVLGRLGGGHGGDRHVLATATAASRLSRSFAILAETLRRLRTGGSQVIRIERVEVSDGGQTVIGNFKTHRSEPNK
jgi:hypothetical protein